jgi:hypothetical protein
LNDLVRRDRNHPSLVIWGLLNENGAGRFYNAAKAWLPSLRAVDDTRLVLLNSGRWDCDLKTASASNPGSTTWDAYLGGEGPAASAASGGLGDESNAYRNPGGAGDVHVYQRYPTTWSFIEAFAELGRNTKPVFVSEGGLGSSFNAIRADRKMREAGAPDNVPPWRWIAKGVEGLRQTWPKHHLETLYPSIEDMLIDSELNAARQRELMFSIIRANPRISGYSLTSLTDFGGQAEGVMDGFREFKPGHLAVLQAGWAKLRWCLLVNPMHVYADRPFRIKVALASEDALSAGVYPATLRITAGLQTKIMTPDYYGEILSETKLFREVSAPGEAVAVAIYCTGYPFQFQEGVMLGVYNHHAGKLTLNSLQLARMLGHPAADRLLLNMVAHAQAGAAPRTDRPPK